jgi:iron complex transport system substrate-binding protein
MRERVQALTLILSLALLVAACAAPSTPVPDGGEPALVVTDALGREVAFESPPQRIVVAGRGTFMVNDALFMFPEATERVVALTGQGLMEPSRFLTVVDPHAGEKTLLEHDAGPEQIAPLAPDVVILKSYAAERLGKPLEALHIPVVYVDLETPEQFYRDLETLGTLLGDEARAAELADFYAARQARVEGVAEGAEAHPRVLVLSYSDKGGEVAFKVWPASWMQTRLVQMAGGEPVWLGAAGGDRASTVNFEQIAAWDADQIFVVTYRQDPGPIVEGLQSDPRWQELRAVRAGDLYGFPADFYGWDMPDPRWILGATWLADKIHPQALDLDMREEVETFFRTAYDLDESAVADKILPELVGDVNLGK